MEQTSICFNMCVLCRSNTRWSRMEGEEGNLESSTEVSNDTAAQNDRITDLNSKINKLKRELDAVKKKLHKAEFERDSAQRNAENLKSEVKELSKKLHEERKKSAESRKKNSDALRANENIQDTCKWINFFNFVLFLCNSPISIF